jgi:hypothetical protein
MERGRLGRLADQVVQQQFRHLQGDHRRGFLGEITGHPGVVLAEVVEHGTQAMRREFHERLLRSGQRHVAPAEFLHEPDGPGLRGVTQEDSGGVLGETHQIRHRDDRGMQAAIHAPVIARPALDGLRRPAGGVPLVGGGSPQQVAHRQHITA